MEAQKIMFGEELYDVPDFEGLYMITKGGRVWNCTKEEWMLSRKRSHLHDYYAQVKGCIGVDKKDFLCVRLVKTKSWGVYDIHRLMAKTFLENKEGYKYVHHIDFDRTNNKLKNLMWTAKPINKRKKLYADRLINIKNIAKYNKKQ